jgi:hypothetical protein
MALAEAQAFGLYQNNGSIEGYAGLIRTLPLSYSANAAPASTQDYLISAEHEISEVMGRKSLLNNAPNDYALMDLCLYSWPDVGNLTIAGTGSTADFSMDNGTTNLGIWNSQTSNGDPENWYPQDAAPGADGSGTNVLTFSHTVGTTDSNVSSLAVKSINLNGEAIGNNSSGGAAADEAHGTLPPASGIQVLNDLSSGGSHNGYAMMQIVHDIAPGASLAFYTAFDSEQDFANGMLATNVANAQDTASHALGTLQGSTWQFSMTPVGNSSAASPTIWTGGEGNSHYQSPITGLHAAAPADGGATAVAASFAPATFAPVPADLASLSNLVVGPYVVGPAGPYVVGPGPGGVNGIGPNGATPAQVQQALDESGLGVNGAGITVGVLSDSFNNKGGAVTDEADGALPTASNVNVLKDLASGGSDEGRAMMQIVHDVAPSAKLDFYTGDNSEADFAAGILALAAAGCKVICDDVTYFDEPFFQTGVVANAIQTVEQEGVTYLTCAGNQAAAAYQSAWTPIASTTYDGTTLTDTENFGSNSPVQTVTLSGATGTYIPLILQWNQPDGATTANLKVLVFSGGSLVGTATNTSSGEPSNPYIQINLGTGFTYQVAVENLNSSNTNPTLIKDILYNDSGAFTVSISGENAGTVVGHHMSPDAITVGAVSSSNTPAFGVSPAVSEGFSSSGLNTQLWFNYDGTSVTGGPLNLSPVAVSGVDNINTSVTGGLTDFYGTSAATPSVAGVVALMLQANPDLTPVQINALLVQSAASMANSNVAGAGLVQANVAVDLALSRSASADFNGNGKSDILWHNTGGEVGAWLMNGAQPLSYAKIGNAPTGWSVIGTGDFNGDGTSDILWQNNTNGDVGTWLMNGTQPLSYAKIGSAPTGWSIVGTGYFNNGDGQTDILWENNTNGDVGTWLMNGTQPLSYAKIGNAPTGWSIIGTGDFTGNGETDILWQNTNGDLGIWLMNGTQAVSFANIGLAPTGWTVAASAAQTYTLTSGATLYIGVNAEAGSTAGTTSISQTNVKSAQTGMELNFNALAGITSTLVGNEQAAVASATSLTNAENAAAHALGGNGIAFFNYSGNTYVIGVGGSEAAVSSTDSVVELVGVVFTGIHSVSAGIIAIG